MSVICRPEMEKNTEMIILRIWEQAKDVKGSPMYF